MIKNLNIGNIKNIGRENYQKAIKASTHLLAGKLLVCDDKPQRNPEHYYEKLSDLVTDTSIKNSPEYTKTK